MRNPFALHGPDYKSGKPEPRTVVGTYLPHHLTDLLAVHSVVRGIPKSKVMELALAEYLQRNQKGTSQVTPLLIQRIQAAWDLHKLESAGRLDWKPSKEFEHYKTTIFQTLKKRGLPKDIINEIKQTVNTWSA